MQALNAGNPVFACVRFFARLINRGSRPFWDEMHTVPITLVKSGSSSIYCRIPCSPQHPYKPRLGEDTFPMLNHYTICTHQHRHGQMLDICRQATPSCGGGMTMPNDSPGSASFSVCPGEKA
jgi:hypothetical protein